MRFFFVFWAAASLVVDVVKRIKRIFNITADGSLRRFAHKMFQSYLISRIAKIYKILPKFQFLLTLNMFLIDRVPIFLTLPQQILDLCSWYFFNAFLWNRKLFQKQFAHCWMQFQKSSMKNTMERGSENFLSTLITSERRLQFRGSDLNVIFLSCYPFDSRESMYFILCTSLQILN